MASSTVLAPRGRDSGRRTARPAGRPPPGWLLVALPAVVAFALSVAYSWRPSYWLDETVSVSTSVRPLDQLPHLLRHTDAVHGLYYLLMHPWAQVSVDAWWMRLPSAFAVAGTAALVAVLGWQLAGRRTALLAGSVFALLPVTSYYGMEARGYALAMMASAATLVSLVRAVRTDRRRWWLAYGALLVLATWIFLFSVILVAGHASYVLLARERSGRPVRRWLTTAAVAALAVAPLAVLAADQSPQVGWVARPTLASTAALWSSLWFSYSTRLALLVWALVAVAVVTGLVPRLRRRPADRDLVALGLGAAALPPGLLLAVSLADPLFVPRYVLGCVVPLSLLAGYGLSRLPFRATAVVGLALVFVAGFPAQRYQRQVYGKGDVLSSLAAVVQQQRRPGDAVAFLPEWWRSGADAYPAAFGGLPDIALPAAVDRSRTVTGVALSPAQMVQRLAGTRRVWVLGEAGNPALGAADARLVRSERQALAAAGFVTARIYPGARSALVLMTRP